VAFLFVFITVVLDMLAVGIIIPVLPQLVLGFLHGDTVRAAQIFGAFGTIFALMQFVAAPVLGVLSDRFGRKPVIVASNFGAGFDYIVMALAPTVGWLFLGRLISGVTAASLPTAYAYIADVTPPEKRAGNFAMLGAAFGLGFIVGPAAGGLLGSVDPRLPFWVAGVLSLANALYGMVVLPESLERERRSASFSWKRANPVGALALLRTNAVLLGLAAVMFLDYLAHEAFNVFVLYVNHRFGWDARAVGVTLAFVGVCSAIVQVGLVARAVSRLGERLTLLLGLGFGVIGFLCFGLVPTGALFWLAILPLSLWGLATPAAQGLMSARVASSEQGQLQGALTSVRGIAMLIGPGIFTLTYAAFVGPLAALDLQGAPYLLSALCMAASFALTVVVTRGIPLRRVAPPEAETPGPAQLFPVDEVTP
jgi:DHA1 family tetracycline resistance protein-like MFS transporter